MFEDVTGAEMSENHAKLTLVGCLGRPRTSIQQCTVEARRHAINWKEVVLELAHNSTQICDLVQTDAVQ